MNGAGGIAERAFFREEFRRRTIVIALADTEADVTLPVIRELLAGECRVLVVMGRAIGGADDRASDLASALSTELVGTPASLTDLAQLWTVLEDTGVRIVGVDDDDPASVAAELASHLGVSKLVVTDPGGGWGKSFASLDDLDGPASARPVVADSVRRALSGGVGGVNVCRADDLDTELFTFDGAGTLFTADAYVQVTRLGADDLAVFEQLVARGVAEGFLRPRQRSEVIQLALGGLGARVGPNRHLAGFGTLETARYVSDKVAEVACLYTVNRYAGEGVGGRLVDGLVDAARRAGVDAVFACTVSDRAAALFERCGFHEVSQDHLPAAKWVDYDAGRRDEVLAHWLDLGVDGAGGLERNHS